MLTGKSGGREIAGLTIGAISGALTNTILVMGLIYLIFSNAYAVANGMPVEKVLKTICGIVIANGGPEALVAAILTPSIALGIKKAVKH